MKFPTALIAMLSAPLSRSTGRALLRLGSCSWWRSWCFSAGFQAVMIVADAEEGATLHDEGYRVLVGDRDDPATY